MHACVRAVLYNRRYPALGIGTGVSYVMLSLCYRTCLSRFHVMSYAAVMFCVFLTLRLLLAFPGRLKNLFLFPNVHYNSTFTQLEPSSRASNNTFGINNRTDPTRLIDPVTTLCREVVEDENQVVGS